MQEKPLAFGRMQKNKTFFFVFEIGIFYFFSRNFRVNKIFCIGFVSYSVSLWPDIEQN